MHVNDPEVSGYRDIRDLQGHKLQEIRRFFQDYKILEEKEVVVDELGNAEEALQVVIDSFSDYRRDESRLRGW